jgi:hypothetical protein
MGRVLDEIITVSKKYKIPHEAVFGSNKKFGTSRDWRVVAARWRVIHNLCVDNENKVPYHTVAYYLRLDTSSVKYALKKMKKEGHDCMDKKIENMYYKSISRQKNRDLEIKSRRRKKELEKFLSDIHKLIGGVAGEIAISLAARRIHGGSFTLKQWVENLRAAADKIEEKVNADSN